MQIEISASSVDASIQINRLTNNLQQLTRSLGAVSEKPLTNSLDTAGKRAGQTAVGLGKLERELSRTQKEAEKAGNELLRLIDQYEALA